MSVLPPPGSPDRPAPVDEATVLRAALRRRRRALTADARIAADAALGRSLLELDVLSTPGTLATYLPTDGEIDPNGALDELRRRGWTIVLPVVGPGRSMAFARWDDTTTFRANRFGIDEPSAPVVVDPAHLDVVLVPCVALDPAGHRLGFGAGFYDRAFAPDATTPPRGAVLVGVVHDLQLVERLEAHAWDVPMDRIVTDSRVIDPRP